jgi:hypothetical protein
MLLVSYEDYQEPSPEMLFAEDAKRKQAESRSVKTKTE